MQIGAGWPLVVLVVYLYENAACLFVLSSKVPSCDWAHIPLAGKAKALELEAIEKKVIQHGNKFSDDTIAKMEAREECLVQCPHCDYVYTTSFSREKIRKNIKHGSKIAPLKTVCKNPNDCAPKTRGKLNAQRAKLDNPKNGVTNSIFNANSMQNCHIWACASTKTRTKVRTLQRIAEACNIGLGKATRAEAIRLHRIETNTRNSKGIPYPFKRWDKLLDGE